jgi:CRISPR-associated protein Cas2
MFVIISYDITEQYRITKVRKILKKFLTWTQNSLFEGDIQESKLAKCLALINKIIDKDTDSIYIYKITNSNNIKKEVLGQEKNLDDILL